MAKDNANGGNRIWVVIGGVATIIIALCALVTLLAPDLRYDIMYCFHTPRVVDITEDGILMVKMQNSKPIPIKGVRIQSML